ncbi:MAG: sulfate adenylyltransferase [Nitrospirota bacterium]
MMAVKEAAPHGGRLINRILKGKEAKDAEARAKDLDRIRLNDREISDLELIAIGAYSPLEGFMAKADYENVINNMRLADGLPWSIPITLTVTKEKASMLKKGSDLALVNDSDMTVALLHLKEIYPIEKEKEASMVFGTTSMEHPGVAALYEKGDMILGGRIDLIHRPNHDDFTQYRLDPEETRRQFKEKKWKRIVGFQTRNPIHRAHEYIQKTALEIVDGILVHPLVGATKGDDIPADVRMQCYKVLLDNYYPKERTLLSVYPAFMRYAGPREAIFHAIVRKNYGCTHFIVGRDHAGVGSFYGSFDAHHIFDRYEDGEIGITPLFFDHTFFCKKCGGMASFKTCSHDKECRISLSGTKVREMLRDGIMPPPEFTRPEVASILIDAMAK